MKIFRAWDYSIDGVRYVYRHPETKKVCIGEDKFKYYFYIKTQDYEKHKFFFDKLKYDNLVYGYEKENKYTKVFVQRIHASELLNKNNELVWEYKDKYFNLVLKWLDEKNITHYEADLPVWKRWMIHNKIEIETDYSVLFLDIEVDDEKIQGQPTPGEFQILSCAFIDEATGKSVWLACKKRNDFDSEKEFLLKVAKIINAYDVIVAWNGKFFDFPYLKTRMARFGIQIDWRKKILQDQLQIFKKFGQGMESYSLDYISKALIGTGKIEYGRKIFQLFDENKKALKEYNIQDVNLMHKIEQKTEYLKTARTINIVGFCAVDDEYISRKIDMLILKQVFEDKNYHFKSKDRFKKNEDKNDEEAQYKGAYVFQPLAGVHKNVSIIDFSSLYPSTIRTFNISPDTLVTDENKDEVGSNYLISPSGAKFRKDFIGVLPKVVTATFGMRKKYKELLKTVPPNSVEWKIYDRLQYAYKFFGLSFYGVMGEKHSRFYDVRIAEAVTLGGQFFTKLISQYLEKNNIKILMGDTDSLGINISDEKILYKIIENIKIICSEYAKKKFGANESYLEMAYDKGFKKVLLADVKKRYAGYLSFIDGQKLENPKLLIKGYESIRTDQCKLAKETQKELFKLILRDENVTLEELQNFVLNIKNKVLYGNIDIEDITFGQKLTKPVDEYEGRIMNKLVAQEMMNDDKEVWVGDKIVYFIESVDKNGKPIPKPVYKFKGDFARVYYWNNKIYPCLERVLKIACAMFDWNTYYIVLNSKRESAVGMNLWD